MLIELELEIKDGVATWVATCGAQKVEFPCVTYDTVPAALEAARELFAWQGVIAR